MKKPNPTVTADYARLMILDDQIRLAYEHVKLLNDMGLTSSERYKTAVEQCNAKITEANAIRARLGVN